MIPLFPAILCLALALSASFVLGGYVRQRTLLCPASPLRRTRYALPDTEVPIAEGEVQALLLARCQRCGVGETIWMDTGTYLPKRNYLYFFDSSEPGRNLKEHGYRYIEGTLLCPVCWQNVCEIVLGSEATRGKGVTA